MLIYYYVIHSTVTKLIFGRLFSIIIKQQLFINQSKIKIMRTLNNNQLSGTLNGTKSHEWNTKRRYR